MTIEQSITLSILPDPELDAAREAKKQDKHQQRGKWGKSVEFLFSCIAMSVGLGNIWRFPIAALRNGGGAFVIPYLIVLFLVGKPIYFMEMVLGQLSSRGTIKIYDFAPGMRGVGVGQVISTFSVSTFYASVLALTLKYLVESFNSDLPWATCKANWTDCKNSTEILVDVINSTDSRKLVPSAALYFSKEVVKEKASIDDGLGDMNWNLVAFLGFSWALVFLIMIKGIRSSGKASYVLAVFPYVILSILLGRAITLPGAWDGIVYFLKPQWREMLNYQVWFDAVTQVFFSLNICFGCVSMYSSYNKFNHNIYRDVNIISILDTCTSLLAGCITFGILGHLSHLTGDTDIYKKTGGGPGLAFVTYPDALAKFQLLPQAFSVLFFLMLYTLGIGSIISMIACCMTVIRDKFPAVKNWQAALVGAILGFAVGTTYLRQGGLEIVSLVDFFGAQWVAFIFAIAELVAVFYIYGVERFCKDIEFMLGFRPGLYWRMCWKYITPAIMISIFIYTMSGFELPTYGNKQQYPSTLYALGWCLTGTCLAMFPIFAMISVLKQKGDSLKEQICGAFKPLNNWGPQDPKLSIDYTNFLNDHLN